MSAITIENDLVHYEVLGRGRPVIFVHGWLGSWRYWVPTMQQLSVKYRTYALDLWGFGDTGKDPRRYEFKDQVLLLQEFMEKLGINKAALVGHGLGAAICLRYANQYPDRAPRVALISPPLYDLGGLDDAAPAVPSAPAPVNITETPAAAVPDAASKPAAEPPLNTDTLPRNPFRGLGDTPEEILARLQAKNVISAAGLGTPGPQKPVAPSTPALPTGIGTPILPKEAPPAPTPAIPATPAASTPTPVSPATPTTTTVPDTTPPVASPPAGGSEPQPVTAVPATTSAASSAPASSTVPVPPSAPAPVQTTAPAAPATTTPATPTVPTAPAAPTTPAAQTPPAAPTVPDVPPAPVLPPLPNLPTLPVLTSSPALPRTDAVNPLLKILTGKPLELLTRFADKDAPDFDKLKAEVEKTDEAAISKSAASFNGVNLAVELHRMASPTLLLHGKLDPFLTAPSDDLIKRIYQGKPAGNLLAFVEDDLRHFPMLEITAKFNRLLMDFFDAQDLNNVQFKDQWRRTMR